MIGVSMIVSGFVVVIMLMFRVSIVVMIFVMAVTVIITVAPVPTVVTNGIAVIDIPQ